MLEVKSRTISTSSKSKPSNSSGSASIVCSTGSMATVTGLICPVTDEKAMFVMLTAIEIESLRERVISWSEGREILDT